MKLFPALIVAMLLFSPSLAEAGNFKVFPVRIHLDADKKTDTLQIQNQGEQPMSLQLQAVAWGQDNVGKDLYEETRNLIFFPQIFKIEPGEVRMIRLGFKNPAGRSEASYRLFIEELPEAGLAEGENALKMLLKMSVPVFIAPAVEKTRQGEISGIAMQDNSLAVTVENTGNAYFFVKSIQARGKAPDGTETVFPETRGWYLLSGSRITYPLEINAALCRGLKELHITVASDEFSIERQFPIDAAACQN